MLCTVKIFDLSTFLLMFLKFSCTSIKFNSILGYILNRTSCLTSVFFTFDNYNRIVIILNFNLFFICFKFYYKNMN